MLATPAEFEDLWNAAIKQDLVDSEDKKLFVFVSTAEADSVCALHILQVRCQLNRQTASIQRVLRCDPCCAVVSILKRAVLRG